MRKYVVVFGLIPYFPNLWGKMVVETKRQSKLILPLDVQIYPNIYYDQVEFLYDKVISGSSPDTCRSGIIYAQQPN